MVQTVLGVVITDTTCENFWKKMMSWLGRKDE